MIGEGGFHEQLKIWACGAQWMRRDDDDDE